MGINMIYYYDLTLNYISYLYTMLIQFYIKSITIQLTNIYISLLSKKQNNIRQ